MDQQLRDGIREIKGFHDKELMLCLQSNSFLILFMFKVFG
jgi:hypothetical protein